MNFWDVSAPVYDLAEKNNGKAYRGMLRAIVSFLPRGASVLECAAGTGSISIACAKKAKYVLCTDASTNMLRVAQKKAAKRNLRNIRFARADIYHLKLADQSFDVTIAAQVLHLLDNPEQAASELKRVTKKMVIVPVCLLADLGFFSRLKVGLWQLFGFAPRQIFSAESYRRFLEKIGLPPDIYYIIDGQMPMAMAIYYKK